MKIAIHILILGYLLNSCQSDDYNQTVRYFTTDKLVYMVGEEIELTAIITPEQEQKTIRFYENYKNLKISFALMNDSMKVHNGDWTNWTGDNLLRTNIQNHVITSLKPFQKPFKIIITEEDEKITLTIPELDYYASFNSEMVLDRNTEIRIHGFCDPINPKRMDSIEDYFEVKDIRIVK